MELIKYDKYMCLSTMTIIFCKWGTFLKSYTINYQFREETKSVKNYRNSSLTVGYSRDSVNVLVIHL